MSPVVLWWTRRKLHSHARAAHPPQYPQRDDCNAEKNNPQQKWASHRLGACRAPARSNEEAPSMKAEWRCDICAAITSLVTSCDMPWGSASTPGSRIWWGREALCGFTATVVLQAHLHWTRSQQVFSTTAPSPARLRQLCQQDPYHSVGSLSFDLSSFCWRIWWANILLP